MISLESFVDHKAILRHDLFADKRYDRYNIPRNETFFIDIGFVLLHIQDLVSYVHNITFYTRGQPIFEVASPALAKHFPAQESRRAGKQLGSAGETTSQISCPRV